MPAVARGCDRARAVPHPLGATVTAGRRQLFRLRQARDRVSTCLLFDGADDRVPTRVIPLDPDVHRTGGYWHAQVPGIAPGQLYGFAAHGPWAPEDGLRFDPTKVLLDPYGRGIVVPGGYRRVDAGRLG